MIQNVDPNDYYEMNSKVSNDVILLKICNKCKKTLENTLNNFSRNRNRADGLHNRCKKCTNEDGKLRKRRIKFQK